MKEPAYPIFFPTYTPIPTGYQRDWWWYDPEVNAEDQGPFDNRADAVADWALNHFSYNLQIELKSLDLALGSPLLLAPLPCSRQEIVDSKLNELKFNVELGQSEYIGLTEQALAITESLQELAAETNCYQASLAAGALSAELRGNLLLAGGAIT